MALSKKVIIFTTGGTIASAFSAEEGGNKPSMSGADLIKSVPNLCEICDVEVNEYSNLMASTFTLEFMFCLAKAVEECLLREDVLGVVITHGTGTIDETAYLLDLTIKSNKPVVLTGSMRTPSELSPDGPKNLYCAVKVAASEQAVGLGVLLVMNEEIHAARNVSKNNASNPAAFTSGCWGPLGYVDGYFISIRNKPVFREYICPEKLGGEVFLLRQVASDNTMIFDYLIEKKVAGIVLEGFGRGNLHAVFQERVEKAVSCNIPVIITTRCNSGYVLPIYSSPGAAVNTHKAGAIFTDELSGMKTRIKLTLALGITTKPDELQKIFSREVGLKYIKTA